MATAIRSIRHEDRLSIIEHLTELRTRLFVCVAALTVAFGFCLWQNHALLHIANSPLEKQTLKNIKKGNGTNGALYYAEQAELGLARDAEQFDRQLASLPGLTAGVRAIARANEKAVAAAVAKVPRQPTVDKPVTLGIGEPFTTTIGISLLFAFIISLPVILFELYGFVLPAFAPNERRIAMPLMTAIPALFACGVAFGYFVVVPAAVRFFQNFNSSEFNVLVQAGQYYRFIGLIILAMGLVFQTPVAIIAVTRAGIVSHKTLAKNRRYAIVLCAAVAAFLPGDAITLLLETVPLYLLFEVSILLASVFARRDAKREARAAAAAAAAARPPGTADGGHAAAGAQQMTDHVDQDLL